MAIYYCHWCDRYVDNDWYPCEEIDGEPVCPRHDETPDQEIHRINKELADMKAKSLNCRGVKLWT